jgi:succinate dehydrogenase / fumarate reductase flavoprotein subunit
LWVDHERSADGGLVGGSPRNHQTTIEGLYAVGDSAALYHGCCRLGGNGLLAALFGARIGARALVSYLEGARRAAEPSAAALADAKKRYKRLCRRKQGDFSAAEIHDRLRVTMETALGLRPPGDEDDLDALCDAGADAGPGDASTRANRGAPAVRDLERMLLFARACAASRGERERDDAPRALKVHVSEDDGEIALTVDAIDVEDMPAEPRRYAEAAP